MAFSSWSTWTTNQTVTAAELNQDIRDNGNALFPDENTADAWSPTLKGTTTNYSTSSVSGREWQVGALQFVWVRFVMDSPPGGSGEMYVELPTNTALLAGGSILGNCFATDSGASVNNETGSALLQNDTTDQIRFAFSGGNASASFPFTWASGDTIGCFACYPFQ